MMIGDEIIAFSEKGEPPQIKKKTINACLFGYIDYISHLAY